MKNVIEKHLHCLTTKNPKHNFPASVKKMWLLEQCPKRAWGGKVYSVKWKNLGLGVWEASLDI